MLSPGAALAVGHMELASRFWKSVKRSRPGSCARRPRTNRKRLIVGGLLTEACVTFPVLSALKEGYEVFVVGDACGCLSLMGHDLALRRMEAVGAKMTCWIQVMLEFQRDWTRHDGARLRSRYDSPRVAMRAKSFEDGAKQETNQCERYDGTKVYAGKPY
jgi:nicotinamidase-related amidase